MPTVADLLARHDLLTAVSDTAVLDTEILLAHCLEKDRTYLRGWPEVVVAEPLVVKFESLLGRRQQGEPVAYLIGSRGFWSFDLKVSPATLIPRPETELLVEKVMQNFQRRPPASLLDLGTGTGAVALALATEFPACRVLACDIELPAVALAESNRQLLGLDNVRVFQSDWFDGVPEQGFDCIVSNPPYIDPEDPHLQRGDVRFEPASALVAENCGLLAIETIVSTAPGYLNSQGWLLFEHGYDQGCAARRLMQAAGFMDVETAKDLAGQDRVTAGRVPG
jgi:release factor glutamine methyltransferase